MPRLLQLPASHRGRRPLQTHRRARLRLEELEARNLLSIFTPVQIRHAYGFDQVSFTSNGQTAAGDGRGQTIALVDAYDAPSITSDLHHFDQTLGLADPPSFTKVNQTGGTSLPAADSGWAGEIALDVEWAHAVAPRANLLLVEAASANLDDLLSAVDYARNQPGVSVVSMSWGDSEFPGESAYDYHFTTPAGHQGVTFVASSGDSGAWYGASWPAVSPNVVAVGGTHLQLLNSAGTYSTESGWNDSGGGYSAYESEPGYQKGVQTTGVRTSPDVAYDADPNTGYYVYLTDPSVGQGYWYQFGGTSAGAPQWAGLVAVADQGLVQAGKGTLDGPGQTLPAIYKLPSSDFHDVTTGYNGYYARSGYDLVTGRGSPLANRVIADLVKAGSGTLTATVATSSTTTGGKTSSSMRIIAVSSPVSGSPDGQQFTAGLTPANRAGVLSLPVVSAAVPQVAGTIAPVNPATLVVPRPIFTTPDHVGDETQPLPAVKGAGDDLAPEVVPDTLPEAMPSAPDDREDAQFDPVVADWSVALTACFAEHGVVASLGADPVADSAPLEGAATALDPLAAVAGLAILVGAYRHSPARKHDERRYWWLRKVTEEGLRA